MNFRLLSKQKVVVLFILLVLIISIIYFKMDFIQENYGDIQNSNDRCYTELTSLKYQLNVVTEYKNRIDKLLTETEKKHKADKEHFKDIMESCVAMKQQAAICQGQFEDLQTECKRVKVDYDNLKDIEKIKNAG